MALKGSFQNVFARSAYALRVEWEVVSQNIPNNNSNIIFNVYLVSSESWATINSSATKKITLYVNNTAISTKEVAGLASLSGNQKKLILSKGYTVNHNTDGTKTITVKASFGIAVTLSGTYYGTVHAPASGTQSITIDRIPRVSTPTTSGTLNVGSTITINTNTENATLFKHTIQYSLNNSSWTNIATNVGASTTWTLPSALATARTSAKTGTVYIRCITYAGTSNLGNKVISRTYNITSSYAAPSVALTVSQTNDASIAQYIRGQSSVTLSATATLKHSAKAAKYVFKYGDTTKTVTSTSSSARVTFTLPANAAASYAYSVTLMDSRGYTASQSGTVTTVAYSTPAISGLTVTRGDYDGTTFTENSKGNNLRIVAHCTLTSLSSANAKNYKIEYRLNNVTTYTTLVNTTAASSYAASIIRYTDAIFSENASYVIRFTLSDSFGTISQIADVSSQKVLMNFSANGKAMCIGGIASVDDALEIALEHYVTGGIKPIALADGTNLDEIVKTGWYVGSQNLQTLVNAPMSTGSFLLEVSSAGTSGQIMQRYSYCHKTTYRAFVRFKYESSWGDWQAAEGFTSFSYADHEGRVRFANGILIQWGRVSITPTAANTVTEQTINFPVEYAKAPAFQVEARSSVPQNITFSGTADAGGATLYLTRTNTSSTSLAWLAIGVSA